ncbi:O-acetyl-ADP-ribose deacetylase (regulator of RNase III), contains Macro domain [Sphingobium sp. YR657]|uniref:type II toxin-antitoxin system antitoxin DNA ADP-ribosyl glycohydrolase DarG n=1 Tax=Sphingobium sp. YR657 TaxID=1884366 RepID=UPI000918E624|nr:macro domain-containing protein [Sphingobium sp. YR657]SHM66801.1 O-acetyl-ADP-ribose deacetylase (regulator of RNase III), contains Macro domain [Sphingobium sp. YR657]
MIRYTTGNLLEARADALVNTVNTVGVMGKGIALMFKEKFPENSKRYEAACANHELKPGAIFVTEGSDMFGPRWIVNFSTKKHWRHPSKMEWIRSGLMELRDFIRANNIRSIAIPPLGAGNGGLEWTSVRNEIERALGDLPDVDIIVFEPTSKYQNVAKRDGVEKLTPARALIAEIVRRYWVLGMECTLLEVQKLAWFLESATKKLADENPLKLNFAANRYGPYADDLRHLLNSLDGSYLACDKRINDAGPFDVIRFNDEKKEKVQAYFTTDEAKPYRSALEATAQLIDGFESPLGMELLATVDWLISVEGAKPSLESIRMGIKAWPGGSGSARRKEAIFDDRLINLALERFERVDHLAH